MIAYLYFHVSPFYLPDGTSTGDGSHIGNCPASFSSYKCLSNGACNVCGLLSNKAEGCNIFSTSPVCDADSSTNGIQATYDTSKVAQCVACKQTGTHKLRIVIILYSILLSHYQNIHFHLNFHVYSFIFQMVHQQETGVTLAIVLHTILLINVFLLDRVMSVVWYLVKQKAVTYFQQLQSVMQILQHQDINQRILILRKEYAPNVKTKVCVIKIQKVFIYSLIVTKTYTWTHIKSNIFLSFYYIFRCVKYVYSARWWIWYGKLSHSLSRL